MTKALILLMAGLAAQPALAAGTASGTVNVSKDGTIRVTQAIAYPSRATRNARVLETEVLLTDTPLTAAAALADALEPHIVAVNDPALRDRNYVVLAVHTDGNISMNATFSKGMVQYINDTGHDLKVDWTVRNATRLEGRLYSTAPMRTMDGTTYAVDLRFAVDVPAAAAGESLPAGGGDPGQAFVALMAAAESRNWNSIKAGLSPAALKRFEEDYLTPAENAENVLDLLKAWIPTLKMKVAGGQRRGDMAILDVEGEMFAGMGSLSLVRMRRVGNTWTFDEATRAGFLP
jgi:hypothetical protein